MSFFNDVILGKYADSKEFKDHFERYCNWCWGHGYGNCDHCRKEYMKLYIPLRISEKQKELGLPQTRKQ